MAATADRTLIGSRRFRWATAFSVVLLGGLLLEVGPVDAEVLYKYRDAGGQWVYSDRRPARFDRLEPVAGDPAAGPSGVQLRETTDNAGEPILVAVNDFAAWVQIAYHVESSRNLDPSTASSGNLLIPPQDQTFIMALAPIDAASPVEVSFSYQYLYGHPGAQHRPDLPYRLPYALNDAHPVSQAYPDTVTHASEAHRYAVDFEMPVGTAVFAAREGIVIETAEDFSGAGLDLQIDAERANFVRILHDDGTLALYGHLDWHSIRVEPGERVTRGQRIADSGNTGYSSGPHLHFVVQRNRAGAMESVPVKFSGSAGSVVSLATGDRPVAY
jgi:murein DD-endopeptidase MepM/ murein hydrolase activator NlpD